MDVFESAFSDFTDDAHQMNDRIDPADPSRQRVGLEDIADMDLPAVRGQFFRDSRSSPFRLADKNAGEMSGFVQLPNNLLANETRGAGDENFHRPRLPFL